jgi:RHS repeat-associated protein
LESIPSCLQTASTTGYYPFGETRYTTGTLNTDHQYTGQQNVAGIGLYNYRARFYYAGLGRFISADSVTPGGPQGLNRYSYVGNSPINKNDPTGRTACDGAMWGSSVCREQRDWEARGLKLAGDDWGLRRISLALVALKRIDKTIGGGKFTDKVLGLDKGGGMTITGVPDGTCPMNRNGCAPGKNIKLQLENWHGPIGLVIDGKKIITFDDDWNFVQTLEHEVGHVIDYVAAHQYGNKYSYYSDIHKNVFNGGNPGYANSYIRTNNREDFAEDFAYLVDTSQGWYPGMDRFDPNYYHADALSMDRMQLIQTVIYGQIYY